MAILLAIALTYYLFLEDSDAHPDPSQFSLHHNRPLRHPGKLHRWQKLFQNEEEKGDHDIEALDFSSDGLLRGWDEIHAKLAQGGLSTREKKQLKSLSATHHIEHLIELGEKRWQDLLDGYVPVSEGFSC